MPSQELLERMTAFNEELVRAGVMLAGEGLHPSARGARVEFSGRERKVIDGPFAETKELLAGYWLWQVKSMDEAIEWAKRIPNPTGENGRGGDPSCVRGRRLRRGVHVGAARAGGAAARADRGDRVAAAVVRRDVTRTIEAVWRIESARLIAGIVRLVRDVALAEDLAQEALLAALEQWPESGVPDNPGAWLMAIAKRRGIDRLRRAEVDQRKTEEFRRDAELARGRTTTLRPRPTTRSTTTCCSSSSPPATRCSRPTREWRSPYGCSAG